MSYLLDGIKVIDLASFLAGPGAATLMADYGAEVIKVEPPGGDGYRRLAGNWKVDYNWQLTSRNKRGMSLNVKSVDGHDVLMRLLEEADVLITNFRNDQLKEYGIDWETLHGRFPRLVLGQLTGYGNDGPDRLRRGYDSTAFFARSGIMEITRKANESPAFPPGGIGDHATAMTLFAGIMMALYKRDREGEGSCVETSLIATGCWTNGMQLQGAIAGFDVGQALDRAGARSPFAMVYTTRDNRHVCMVLTNPGKEFTEISNALGVGEWAADERFANMRQIMKNRDEVRDRFAQAIGAMTLKDLCLALDEKQLTYGVVESLTDVVTDAHLIENRVIVKTESEDPMFEWTIANPIKISGEDTRTIPDPPEYGVDTRSVLAEHGFTEEEVAKLLEDKIVFAGEDAD